MTTSPTVAMLETWRRLVSSLKTTNGLRGATALTALPVEVRLWGRCIPSLEGCWEWQGPQEHRGYGRIVVGGKRWGTHRLAWALRHGMTPSSEQYVCHRCDNPKCANPDHLFLGTAADNARDRSAKDRSATLARNGNYQGKIGQRPEAMRLREQGMTYAEIGARLEMSESTARFVVMGSEAYTAYRRKAS